MAIINGTPVADQLSGTAIADTINGLAGSDSLDGGAGIDAMTGLGGDDTYFVDNIADTAIEAAAGGIDTVRASVTFTIGTQVENLILTGTGNINGTGNTLGNTITGNTGNNLLNGGVGADTMAGLAGDDTYVVDNVGDVVTEAAASGTDTVNVTLNNLGTVVLVDLTAASGVGVIGAQELENVTILGTGLYNITGNTGNNVLIGNASVNVINGGDGDDTLVGLGGNDTLIGGDGDDVFRIDSLGDVTTEAFGAGTGSDTVEAAISIDLTLAQFNAIENATLTGAAALNLTGDETDNVLTGNAGANLIDGGSSGIDLMAGGAGNDTYIVKSNLDVVTETLAGAAGGIDVVRSSVTFTLGANLEQLVLTGAGNLAGTGNELANTITGNGDGNFIDGAAGNDTMSGGDGNDTYIVDSSGDVVTESSGTGGTDRVNATASFTLGNNVENLFLDGTDDINGTGNGLANSLTGNSGDNLLNGLGGNDTMEGFDGDDTYVVDSLLDVVIEDFGEGVDTVNVLFSNAAGNPAVLIDMSAASLPNVSNVLGLAHTDHLTLLGTGLFNITGNTNSNLIFGNASANTINGLLGADTLVGLGGADTLIGGEGNDLFRIDALDTVTELAGGFEGDSDTVEAAFTLDLTANGGVRFANIENATLSGVGAFNLIGTAGANILTGNSGANILTGGAGNDTMDGAGGADTYDVDATTDVVAETLAGAAGGIDTVRSTATFVLANGNNIEKLVLNAGAGAIDGTGNELANTLTGNESANLLDGGAGNDTMIGGAGNDTYVVDATGDSVSETIAVGGGTDLVESSVTFTLGANVENLTLTGLNDINGTGNGLANAIIGNAGDNTINGLVGEDTMTGGAGDDTYYVDNIDDDVIEVDGEGTDTVHVTLNNVGAARLIDLNVAPGAVANVLGLDNVENVTIQGTGLYNITGDGNGNILAGNGSVNTINGGGGSDLLIGGAGADILIGGDGDDVFVIDSLADTVTEAGTVGSGTDTVQATFTLNLATQFVNIENATLSGAAAANLTGTTGANRLEGNAGANRITGGGGTDTLIGGAGNDTFVVNAINNTVIEALGGGTDTVETDVTFTLSANVEKLVLATGAGAINGTGNELANTLTGNGSANILDGAAGIDAMTGLGGNDTYVVDNAGDTAVEALNGGTDLVNSSVTFTLGANVENLTLLGANAINGTGNTLANVITGNDAANVLLGGGGADTLVGLGGDDTYTIDSLTDVVTEANAGGNDTVRISINSATPVTVNLNAASSAGVIGFFHVENVTVLGTGAYTIRGSGADNLITGNASANLITGGIGNDTLVGLGGADTLQGDQGNDLFRVDGLDTITEEVDGGTDTVEAAVALNLTDNKYINVENATLTGAAGVALTGNGGDNVLTGNTGANLISGGGGNDTMDGGNGNDTYIVNGGDTVSESVEGVAGGIDLIQSSVSLTLGANIEKLELQGTAASGTGNALNNTITGNGSANTLNGGAGNDTLIGGAGDDTYVVDATTDVVTEGLNGGTDRVNASATFTLGANVEILVLQGATDINGTGNGLDNAITGNTGNNLLNGLGGADIMTGLAGNDTYVVDNFGDSVVEAGAGGTDTVNITLNKVGVARLVNLTVAPGAVADVIGLVNVENVTILGTGLYNITGSSSDNILIGNASVNTIDGGGGNDTLVGLGGADILIGGDGNDLFRIDSLTDTTTEAATGGSGTDTVEAAFALNLTLAQFDNIENATLTGAAGVALTGDTFNNVLTGNSGANLIDAGAGADVLDGGAGNDTLIGGTGNDTYVVDALGDLVQELAAGDTDLVQASISYTLGFNVENLTLTGTGNINGTGNDANNTITGNAGNNILDGAGGTNTLIGGNGSDTYRIGATDVVTETGNGVGDVDTVEAAFAIDLTAVGLNGIENATLTGNAAVNLTGDAFANLLTGNSAANTLTGANGNDTLDGGLGADILVGGDGSDVYRIDATDTITETGAGVGDSDTVEAAFAIDLTQAAFDGIENATLLGAGAFALIGDDGDNVLIGNGGANTLTGGVGDDTLIGGLGIDTLIGGDGSDVYTIDATDIITETGGTGTDTVEAAFTVNLTLAKFDGIENATLTGIAVGNLIGDAADNTLTGNSAANRLEGAAGDDTLDAGAGNDTVLGGIGNDTIDGSDGNDSLSGGDDDDDIDGGIGNDTVLGEAGDDDLVGGTGNDRLDGGVGNDTLDGGADNDTLIGGAGDDSYIVDAVGDVITESAGGGADHVRIQFNNIDIDNSVLIDLTALSSSGVIGARNTEDVTIAGTGLFDVTGNDADNVINGNGSINTLIGGLGNDTLVGGGGSDNLYGGEGTNRMEGGSGNDSFFTSSASDTIVELGGGGTIDRLFVLYSNLGAVQTINLSTLSGGNVEWAFIQGSGLFNVIGSASNNFITGNSSANNIDGGNGADILNGGGGNDTLIGGFGDDDLDGAGGADSMDGGSGNDVYGVDDVGDVIAVDTSGTDTVGASITFSIAARADLENLTLVGTNEIDGTGNAGNNNLQGNAANNTLTGGLGNDTFNALSADVSGNDTLVGGDGDDLYFVDASTDTIIELVGEGTDTVGATASYVMADNLEILQLVFTFGNINGTGNALDNGIGGNEGANVLNGALGNDTISGNGGLDTLTGGGGADVFIFDASATAVDRVTITDFETTVDKLHFDNAVFTALGVDGTLVAGVFNSTADGIATDADDRLIYNTTNGQLFYDADGSAGGSASVLIATFTGAPTVVEGDFVVI